MGALVFGKAKNAWVQTPKQFFFRIKHAKIVMVNTGWKLSAIILL